MSNLDDLLLTSVTSTKDTLVTLLAGIIPTNAKSIDPYLDVLVDELIEIDCRLFFDAFVVKTSSFKFVFTILYLITLA